MNKRTRIEKFSGPLAATVQAESDCHRPCRSTLSVVDFLEARIADKEESVRKLYLSRLPDNPEEAGDPGPLGKMILAECSRKREIIAEWWSVAAAGGTTHICEADSPKAVALRSVLKILAAGYEDHPDFRDKWRTTN